MVYAFRFANSTYFYNKDVTMKNHKSKNKKYLKQKSRHFATVIWKWHKWTFYWKYSTKSSMRIFAGRRNFRIVKFKHCC